MKRSFIVIFLVSVFTSCFSQDVVTLEQAITLALENNYDVRIAQTNLKAAATDNDYSFAAFLPQLNAVGNYTVNDTDQEFRFENAANNRSGNAKSISYGGSLQLVWTLFDGTRMFATRERIEQLERQGSLQVKEQMVNTIAAIITNYYDVIRQKQQLRAIQEQMLVNEERVKLAERKLEVGIGAKPELLQARVDLNAQRASIVQQQTLIVQLKENLNTLLDMKLPVVYDVADTILINTSLQREEVFDKVNTGNYSLLATQRSLFISQLTMRERKAERLPILNFVSSYNITHNDNVRLINPFSALQSDFQGFNYGLTLNIPILNGFNTQRLVQQSKIVYDRQQLLYDQQRTTVSAAARNAYINYQNALTILAIEEENILLAKENVSIALESFKRGSTTMIELRTTQQSLELAYNRLINARYNAKVSETELLRLSGALLK
ncbi:TolC family protein [Chryseotalea sanaruensis]|uniref:TolC family protein n=1 Tax=Chryseotalea sanaruensis TaxID=2482724 RepID=A0A401U7N6_9BACT|nr:TolC family protein [Chryseotalea sanaruensis]GCC50903.1 TolC family protein [Chryseotalea sanaruensis]